MKIERFLKSILFSTALLFVMGCDTDEPVGSNSYSNNKNNSVTITAPEFKKNLTTTTYTDVSLTGRFSNGGDSNNNMSCTVHWRRYGSKPSTTPKKSDMTNHESMRMIASTSQTVTFRKEHTGFNGGNYIYYYFECENSKYITETSVTFCVVKRI